MPDDVLEGAQVERAFRRRHRCRPDCASCRLAQQHGQPPSLVERFGALVVGDSGWRLAQSHVESAQHFPPFSHDPFEQWLVEEALLLRYRLKRAIESQDEDRRAAAAEEGRNLLEAHRSSGGLEA